MDNKLERKMLDKLEKDMLYKPAQGLSNPPKFWGNSQIVDPFLEKRRQEELDNLLKQLQASQNNQSTTYTTYELREVNERLRLIEGSLETLMNMLKLILTTQIEKEMKDKENN